MFMYSAQPYSPSQRAHRHVLNLLLIAALGILVYSNIFDSPFVFDDEVFIQKNPLITDFKYFTDPYAVDEIGTLRLKKPLTKSVFKRRMISFLSFALSYRANGLEVRGFHIFNIAIHILNALLLYLLVLLTFRTPRMKGSSLKGMAGPLALVSALVFICHPLQTQAVNYISQRFVSSGKAPRYVLYALSFMSASLGMLSKEITFTLPVMIALYEFTFFEGLTSKRLIRLLPFALTMFIIPYMLLSGTQDIGQAFRTPTSEYTRWQYLITQFTVIVTYIRLLFVPVNQSLDYGFSPYSSFLTPQVLFSFLFLLSVFLFVFWFYRRTRSDDGAFRLIPFGLLWFFITVSVTSSVVPTANLLFEHRVYLPSVGVFLALTTGVFLIIKRLESKKITLFAVLSLILILLLLSYAAYARNSVWGSVVTLWEDVVSKSPGSAKAHYNLGLAYTYKGMTDKAIEQYQFVIMIKPDHAKAHRKLGDAYLSKGMVDKAMDHYRISIGIASIRMKDFLRSINRTKEQVQKPSPYNEKVHK
jgi:uncharacterized membrane protein HdeD (DUF308 family)